MPSFPQLLRRRPSLLLARAAVASSHLIDLTLEVVGLDSRQYAVLALLDVAEGPMAQQAMAARLERDRTTVMEIVDQLQRTGSSNGSPTRRTAG